MDVGDDKTVVTTNGGSGDNGRHQGNGTATNGQHLGQDGAEDGTTATDDSNGRQRRPTKMTTEGRGGTRRQWVTAAT